MTFAETDQRARFLWGDPTCLTVPEVMPSMRLCRPGAELPGVVQPLVAPGTKCVRTLVRAGRPVATVYEDDDAVYLLAAGVLPADCTAARGAQSASVFEELEGILVEAGMTFRQVVRTWLYIDRVCEWYGEFNAARTAFFEKRHVFETFLPASTGIGTPNLDGAALMAGAFAMLPKRQGVRAELVESPLQAPAMAYKSSFSRAAEIVTSVGRQLFVSGTASIKPNSHEVAFVGDVGKQVDCTMNAVHAILASRGYGWADVSRAIVYLKRPEFRAAWEAWRTAQGLPAAFAAETVCDVCRDEWLFEIEMDAVKGTRRI